MTAPRPQQRRIGRRGHARDVSHAAPACDEAKSVTAAERGVEGALTAKPG